MFQVCIGGKYFLLHIGETGKYVWEPSYGVFDEKPLPGISFAPATYSAPQKLIEFVSKQEQAA